jgi:hypothetical protein
MNVTILCVQYVVMPCICESSSRIKYNRLNIIFGHIRPGSLMRSLRNSFVVSVDMAHGIHPNYAGKHDRFDMNINFFGSVDVTCVCMYVCMYPCTYLKSLWFMYVVRRK